MKKVSNICLFCRSKGPFTRVEHPIPESLGNDDTALPPGYVCDKCNQYFGTKIEQKILSSPPFSVERVAAAIKTKKGKYARFISPEVSLYSTGFWDQVVFYGSSAWCKEIFTEPNCGVFWVDRPMDQRSILSRFLLKIGLELLLFTESDDPYDGQYDRARQCSRYGDGCSDWQVGYAQYPNHSKLVTAKCENELGPLETRQIYQYEIGMMPNGDRIFSFAFITHCFACNLSQPQLDEYIEGFNSLNDFRMMFMP